MVDYRVPSLATFNWQPPINDRVTAPTEVETQGTRYLIIATATGIFATHENKIATAKQANPTLIGHWYLDVPDEGWIIWVKDEDLFYVYDGSNWGILYQNLKTTASPSFAGLTLTGNLVVPNDGTIGQAAGPLLTFDDTNNYLEITGCNVGIGTTVPDRILEINSATGINLRLTYNDSNGSAANYVDYLVTSGGNGTITPSGGLLTLTGNLLLTAIKSGATQEAAGAVANELWKTSGHATLPNNVVMIGS